MPARELTGNGVTDSAALVEAKFVGAVVAASEPRARLVSQAYAAARTEPATQRPMPSEPSLGAVPTTPTVTG